ncbi:Ecp56 [Fulvia fulva]|uniref:Ecp56 n=1 Tax=Passalora fulva TaxID=5499 RepID=A0A1P8YXP2_PASFU|nr:Ecp56 [Fulvia fulva]AQA29281.1 extracellular protein 56 [Fulvia fulva]KAK4616157.1 Ecp56 [Fulvia fulva]KAK4617020.1 Ecp56 [Fulvia fulva]UJO22664.1 Ecp56 [Fulvia fulva]WPV19346.1 Ecp56 [Fulvia fulva]
MFGHATILGAILSIIMAASAANFPDCRSTGNACPPNYACCQIKSNGQIRHTCLPGDCNDL